DPRPRRRASASPAGELPRTAGRTGMSKHVSRRDFLVKGALTGAAASAGLANARSLPAAGAAPAVHVRAARPVVVGSANGHQYRNGGTETAVELAFRMITEGADVLDAVIAGVNIVELDPEDASVGYGG